MTDGPAEIGFYQPKVIPWVKGTDASGDDVLVPQERITSARAGIITTNELIAEDIENAGGALLVANIPFFANDTNDSYFAARAVRTDTDTIDTSNNQIALTTASFTMGLNPGGEVGDAWTRIYASSMGDGLSGTNALYTGSYLLGYNGSTWDSVRAQGNDSDGVSTSALGVLDTNSYLYGFNGSTWDRIRSATPNSDDIAPASSLRTESYNYRFNGSGFDRTRNNLEITLLPSAQRTASTTSSDFTNYNGVGIVVIVDVTSINATTPSITVDIQGQDPVSGNYYNILTSAAITTVSTNVLTVYPGATVAANVSASTPLPRTFRVNVTNADADPIDYSIGGIVML